MKEKTLIKNPMAPLLIFKSKNFVFNFRKRLQLFTPALFRVMNQAKEKVVLSVELRRQI
jgi:hypothetical protein